jgi:integrase
MPRAAAHRIRLNKTNVAGLPVPAKPGYVWDSDLQGFGCRLSPSGRRTFILVGTTKAGRQVKHKIGVFGQITPEQARAIAARKLGELAAGHDLVQERRDARTAERARLAAPTLAQVAGEYLERHARVHKRTSRTDEWLLGRFVLPALGARRAGEITRGDVEALHRSLRDRPYLANRVLALVSGMFNRAIAWELVDANPAKGVKLFPEQPRSVYLTADEIKRLMDFLAAHPERLLAQAVRLLLLTGGRRAEILGARWEEFDLGGAVWTKPAFRVKQARMHRLPLSEAAVQVLREIAADAVARREAARPHGRIPPASPYLFPAGPAPDDGPLTEINRFWAEVRKKTGITARLHDLRHTHASILASAGLSLSIIGSLLGHSSVAMTARYSHLLDATLRQAAGAVADKIGEYAARPATVVPLPKPPAKA